MQDGLGVVWIFNILCNTQDVTAFSDIVLDIVIRALICELSHFDSKKESKTIIIL